MGAIASIVMTAIAIGKMPSALAVIGGLVFSTVLSLIFVPAMFVMMDDLGQLSWRFGRKLLTSHGENEHPGEPPPAAPPVVEHK
jgi:predicted Na+-dependent transporter